MSDGYGKFKHPILYVSISQVVIWSILILILNFPPLSKGNEKTDKVIPAFPETVSGVQGLSINQPSVDGQSFSLNIGNISIEANTNNGLATAVASTAIMDNFTMKLNSCSKGHQSLKNISQKEEKLPLEEMIQQLQHKVLKQVSKGNLFNQTAKEVAGNVSGIIINNFTIELWNENEVMTGGINASQMKASVLNNTIEFSGIVTIYNNGNILRCNKCSVYIKDHIFLVSGKYYSITKIGEKSGYNKAIDFSLQEVE